MFMQTKASLTCQAIPAETAIDPTEVGQIETLLRRDLTLTDGDIETALDALEETKWLRIAHPRKEHRALHRAGECDGSCSRFEYFRH